MAAERPLSDRRIYSARPTVKVDGRFYERTSRLLQAMQMTEDEGGMSALELRYSNLASHEGGGASLAFEDDQLLRLGAAISVHAGDEQLPQEIFRGPALLDFPLRDGRGHVNLYRRQLRRGRRPQRADVGSVGARAGPRGGSREPGRDAAGWAVRLDRRDRPVRRGRA